MLQLSDLANTTTIKSPAEQATDFRSLKRQPNEIPRYLQAEAFSLHTKF